MELPTVACIGLQRTEMNRCICTWLKLVRFHRIARVGLQQQVYQGLQDDWSQ